MYNPITNQGLRLYILRKVGLKKSFFDYNINKLKYMGLNDGFKGSNRWVQKFSKRNKLILRIFFKVS